MALSTVMTPALTCLAVDRVHERCSRGHMSMGARAHAGKPQQQQQQQQQQQKQKQQQQRQEQCRCGGSRANKSQQ
eukprot:8907-Heterococcus_DN1.PRE.2